MIDVLLEDAPLIAVNKPAGVVVQGAAADEVSLADSVRAFLKAKYNKPGDVYLGIVHRLDRPVSGVTLFSRNSKGAARLSAQFAEHTVEKVYWALVEGQLALGTGTLEHWLVSREHQPVVQVFDQPPRATVAAGREVPRQSILHYRVIREAELQLAARQSLLEISLVTGRTHQIRGQLAHIGHPIVGDRRYGATTILGRAQDADRSIGLHARRLTVQHPVRGTPVVIEAPLPSTWTRHSTG